MEHCNDCDNWIDEIDRSNNRIADLQDRLAKRHAERDELDARLSSAMAATSAAVDSRAAMAETVDRLRQRLAEATGQLATVRQWMAKHGEGWLRPAIRELSSRLLWSDADTAQGEELDAIAGTPRKPGETDSTMRNRIAPGPDKHPPFYVDTDGLTMNQAAQLDAATIAEWERAQKNGRPMVVDSRVSWGQPTAHLSKRTWRKINRHIDETAGKRKREDVEHITMIADNQSRLAGRVTAIDGQISLLGKLHAEAGKADDEIAQRLTALEQELVKLGDLVKRMIDALHCSGPLRGFKP